MTIMLNSFYKMVKTRVRFINIEQLMKHNKLEDR